MTKSLEEVLAQATKYDKTNSKKSLEYLLQVLRPVSADHFLSIDKDLLDLKIHLISSNTLMNLVIMSYYYRSLLSNWFLFKERVRHELLFARGQKDLTEALDDLI